MQDLTHLLPGDPITALAPTAQAGGNQFHSNARAMTAPGSEPASQVNSMPGEITEHPAPEISAAAYDTPVLRGPDGSHVHPDNADRSNPFTVEDGSGWQAGRDTAAPDVLPEVTRRSLIRRGEWNEV
jgi:hypothetical protein